MNWIRGWRGVWKLGEAVEDCILEHLWEEYTMDEESKSGKERDKWASRGSLVTTIKAELLLGLCLRKLYQGNPFYATYIYLYEDFLYIILYITKCSFKNKIKSLSLGFKKSTRVALLVPLHRGAHCLCVLANSFGSPGTPGVQSWSLERRWVLCLSRPGFPECKEPVFTLILSAPRFKIGKISVNYGSFNWSPIAGKGTILGLEDWTGYEGPWTPCGWVWFGQSL